MKRVAGAWLLAVAGGVAAAPANKAADVVHYRQSVMGLIGWNFAPMGAMMKGKVAWDAKAFARRAERVRFLADQTLEGFADASNNGGVETDAKDDIWHDFDDFKAKLDDFIAQAKVLDEAAKSGDEAKTKEQFRKTAETCKACHEKYKAS